MGEMTDDALAEEEHLAALPELPYFCICDEEMCFCSNMVATIDTPCATCAGGTHVWSP